MEIGLAVLIAFGVSTALSFFIASHRSLHWLDHPNERSLHQTPVPRLGGVAICAGLIGAAFFSRTMLIGVVGIYHVVAVSVLLAVALLDDQKGLHPLWRFLAQAIAASLLVWGDHVYFYTEWMPYIWPWIGVLLLMWSINLFNFMDGMDGFAGSMGVVGFAALAVLGAISGQYGFAGMCAIVSAACAGFLCFNFPPARLFMGDSGSTALGLAMGVFSVQGWMLHIYPWWVPAIIFSPFWVDATWTLVKRLLRGEKVWQAHRQHFYQRWVLAGYSHRRVAGLNSLLMLVCAISVIVWHAASQAYSEVGLPIVWIAGYSIILAGSEYQLRRLERRNSEHE
jgi:UDP-N-acetylmuramyl pentapeptide phosphotransferase/UDP-N-acetylglucosamine-1-phosphate transferase